MGSTVYIPVRGNLQGLGSRWFNVSGESSGAHHSGRVLGSYLDNGFIPNGLRHA